MNNKPVLKDFTRYVSLSVIGMICISCYVLVDTFFIALALGPTGLAALNISIAIFSVLQGVALMIGIGGATQYAIFKSKTVFTHALAVAALASVIFMAAGIFFTTPIALALGSDAETLPMTTAYIRTILLFSPFFMLNNILIAFIRNDNSPKLAMAGMVTGSFSNIVLDYIFLFPLGLGMFGAALATGLSLMLSVCVLSLHFWRRQNQFSLQRCKIRMKKIANVALLGSSALINELAFAVALITFNLVILGIAGNIGVAAFGIIANIAFVALSIFTGVAQGIQPLISRGHGNGDNLLIKLTLKYAIITVGVLSAALYIVSFFNTTVIVAAFNSENNPTLAMLAESGVRIYFIGLIFAAVNIVASAFFSAIDNAKIAVIISILRSCAVIIPMVLVLSILHGMYGVWFSFVFTELIVFALAVWLLRYLFLSRRA